jgi:hypothetical protein
VSATPLPEPPAATTQLPALDTKRSATIAAAVVAGIVLIAGAVNATLIYDDIYLDKYFSSLTHHFSPPTVLKALFFSGPEVYGPEEYRLYGLSKILQVGLWSLFGIHAWAYGAFIGASQIATGGLLYRILRRLKLDVIQSGAMAAIWIFSIFASTTCFHHYSYLILPYQLTVACAFVLQRRHDHATFTWLWRFLAVILPLAIAWTGEAHLIAAAVILGFVAIATPSPRVLRQRLADLAVPLLLIGVAVAFHRLCWSALLSQSQVRTRYIFGMPTWGQAVSRTANFLVSLFVGITQQVRPVITFAGWHFAAIVCGLAAVAGVIWFRRGSLQRSLVSQQDCGRAAVLSWGLLTVLLASLVVFWALALFTGLISPVLPRRYGYVPYTLAAMLVVALLTEPWIRRTVSWIPAATVCIAMLSMWVALQAYCLPVVRAQDNRVWTAVKAAMAGKKGDSVLLINSWGDPDSPDYRLIPSTPGLRGRESPAIFESPLMADFWQSQYAVDVLGVRYSGYRYVPDDPAHVRVFGSGMLMEESIVVPKESVVVIADPALVPPSWDSSLDRIRVFGRLEDFETFAFSHGVTLEAGWATASETTGTAGVTIDLGQKSDPPVSPGVLPDKLFTDPFHGTGIVANYGLETGEDRIFPFPSSPPTGPLDYYRTNRQGSFTYRIDLTDTTPKQLILDVLEGWDVAPGRRRMLIEVTLDGRPFSRQTIDVAAKAGRTPLAIKFTVRQARSVRVRVAPAPGPNEIPYLNGIRVLPTANP